MELERDDERKEARYANLFRVGFNALEFLLVFGQQFDDSEEERIHTRIVISPLHAKAFCELLESSLREYERTFQPISDPEKK